MWFVLLPNQCGTSQSTLIRGQRPRCPSFLPPIDVGLPPNPPPLGPNVLTGTPPRVNPLRGTARRLAHRPMSGSNTICNDPNPPLANIVLFGLSLSGFPSRLENASIRGRFSHSYKWWFVFLPNQRGTSQNMKLNSYLIMSLEDETRIKHQTNPKSEVK